MANSRANIYPIQLQGAELNLNKLDAEIKQYSGFNKNNSPFVGGCLANVFTKEEQLEGANDNNTIITEDGTVYKVDTTGLYKNDEKLIDTEGKDFYDVKELSYPSGILYIYDEDTYLYLKNGEIFFHSGKIDTRFFLPYGESEDYTTYKYLRFNIIRRVISDITFYIVGILFYDNNELPGGTITDSNSKLYINFYKESSDGELEAVFTKKIGSEYFIGCQTADLKYNLIFKTNGDTYSDFKLIIITGYTLHTDTAPRNNFIFTFDGSEITLGSKVKFYLSSSSSEIRGIGILNQYFFTDDYVYSIPCNIKIDSTRVSTTITPHCVINSPRMNYVIDFNTPSITVDNTNAGSHYDSYRSRIVSFNKWGTAYGTIVKDSSTPVKYCPLAVDDDRTNLVSSGGRFNVGGIVNNCVLTNNGVISGLALPGGWILASEWNTVDEDSLFFGENNEDWRNNKFIYIWKNINNGNWYVLKKSTPKVKRINNQIIINSNTILNSYDFIRDKLLLFAPGWNNRHPPKAFRNSFSTDYNKDRQYYASCINEYDLEDNPSIILNPVPVVLAVASSFWEDLEILYRNYNVIIDKEFIKINFYSNSTIGADITTIKNWYTLYVGENNEFVVSHTGDNVEQTVFPTNTDGNIAYSPSLFAEQKGKYGNLIFISEQGTAYKLMTYDNKAVMSYYLTTAVEGLQDFFTIQGQLYGILNDDIYNFTIVNEVANRGDFIVSVSNLQFVGNTPYEALFFSKTNRCLYSFTGANVLNQKQFVDKISEVRNYLYNPATQTVFLVTDIGVIFYSAFGQFLLEYTNVTKVFLQNNGIILSFNNGNYRFVKYYLDEGDTDFEKQRIKLETCFYGMNNEVVTINDCLYVRLFSEEHEEGNLEISATTLSLQGRMTEKTTFNIKASDWDAITHTIYLRYQPKEQRGLGISFSIDSPFKIASLSVGSQADAVLVDKISKKAITAPSVTSNDDDEW